MRIRHHASLGLWCGNNEIEGNFMTGFVGNKPAERGEYIRLFENILPNLVDRYDPDTFYWPSSPSSCGGFEDSNAADRGDVHYWDVWHLNKPFTEYRKNLFRFVSEFGFQSFPCEKTVKSFTLPQDRNIFSRVMEIHQRNNSANGRILNYLAQTFLYPADFDTLLYASQLLQAEAIRYGVEHWRRNRGHCMGAIYWQLNDCWPVASWASIDYFGRWKALHYYAKRFFAPVLLSCCEEGTLTQRTNINAEMPESNVKKSIQLNVSNETKDRQQYSVVWALRHGDGQIIEEGTETGTIGALSTVWLEKHDFADADLYGDYVSYALFLNGKQASDGSVLFCAPKHFRFIDPELELSVGNGEVTVTAHAYARSVEITCEDGDVLLEDNYFDMNGGSKTVRIVKGLGTKFEVRSVFDIR